MKHSSTVAVPSPVRLLALGATVVVVSSFVGVLYHVIDVISDPGAFIVLVGAAFLGATVFAWWVPVRYAVALASLLLVGGLGWYLTVLGEDSWSMLPHVEYTLSLLTGQSVLGIVSLEAWVLAVTPAPVFLTWYFAMRRRYVRSAVVGGATTLFFVLTGDATGELTLLGVVGVVALIGVGELDRLGGSVTDVDVVAAIVALAIVTSTLVTLVPAGQGYTFSPDTGFQSPRGDSGGGGADDTIEGSLLNADDQLSIVGSLNLSSELRYRVQSSEEQYWRVGSYDVYTGDGWIRRGDTASLDRLGTPPDDHRTVEQRFEILTKTKTMPAVWRPDAVSGSIAEDAKVTSLGGLTPTRSLQANETYSVRSAVPDPTLSELRAPVNSTAEYPDSIADRFLQLPESTPDRVTDRTDRLTANATNPHETARVIEQWLETNREYSLNVTRPSGNIVDAFLFEMERGYCTYYATAMTVMLRTQDIPARMAVGYSPGQRVSADEWIVRGHNAHAWVEVYFKDVGWVQFDPTPAGPRESAEQNDLEQARASNATNVDTNDSLSEERTPTPTPQEDTDSVSESDQPDGALDSVTPDRMGESQPVNATIEPPAETPTDTESGNEPTSIPASGLGVPTPEQTALGVLAMAGLVGIVSRSGLLERGYRAFWLRYQPRSDDPARDVQQAFERLSVLLEQRHRTRKPGETVRAYLDAIDADDRARRVAVIHERARYAGHVDPAAAEEAIELVDEIRTN
ncbi:MAG: transglutaminase domain-containing protein [Halanaeroarchaeum sp.]